MTITEKMELAFELCNSILCDKCPIASDNSCEINFATATEEELDDVINKFRGNIDNAVDHPSHYTDGNIECIDYIKDKLTAEEFQGFCKGNALKYISRAGKKNPDKYNEDLEKAVWYLNKAINERGNTDEDND